MLYEEKPQIHSLTKEENLLNGLSAKPPPLGIKFDKVTCRWLPDHTDPNLNKVSVTVAPGKLLAVIGPVGAGKVG